MPIIVGQGLAVLAAGAGWAIKNSCEVINKLKSQGFRTFSLSTYFFFTLYTTLPHNLIKDKLGDLIERTFKREGSLYIACNDMNVFFHI